MSAQRRRPWPVLVVVVAAAIATVVGWSAGGVSAHAQLVGVDPPDGAVLQDTPAAATLTFSEHVSLTGGSARVLDQHATVVSGPPRVEGDKVIIPLAGRLADGTYTVTWVAISQDSHPVSGATVFSIGKPSTTAAAAPAAPSAGWGVRFVAGALVAASYAGALLAVGGWWFLVVVAAGGVDDERSFRRRLRALIVRAAVLGAVAAVVSIPLRIARLGGGMGALRDNALLGASLRGPIGVSTAVTAAALLVLAGLVEQPANAERRSGQILTVIIGLVALAGFAIEGHTRSQHPVPLMIAFDVIHLTAAAIWFGGIVGLVVAYRSGPHPDVLARVVGRFSTIAAYAVAAVAAAGTAMAILIIPTPGALLSTGYGLILLLKVGLVAGVVAMGGYNRRRLVPAVSVSAAAPPLRRRRLGRIVTAEMAVLVAVVAVTAVLVNQSPVAASKPAPAASGAAASVGTVDVPLSSGAGTASYSFVPALPGQNEMVLALHDPAGNPLQPVEDPFIELTEPTLHVGPLHPIIHPLGAGQYHVIADTPIAGTYQLVIRVRTSTYTETTATSQITINK